MTGSGFLPSEVLRFDRTGFGAFQGHGGSISSAEELQRRAYVSPWLVAIIYAELGDREKAFLWLEKAYQGREHDLAFARVWPMFDGLRSDPRYQELIRRVGLPE